MTNITLYCGINETKWNQHPVMPGRYACVPPVQGASTKNRKINRVSVPRETEVIQDSGAFCDSTDARLSFEEALNRQLLHSKKFGYSNNVTHMASYDLLIDEKWENGQRRKDRWSPDDAEYAVRETVESARYITSVRDKLNCGLVLSAQGVYPEQYLRCAKQIFPLIDPGRDILGLGGWCILGIRKSYLSQFQETISLVIPEAAKYGIKKVHIWGVLYLPALGNLLWMCDRHGMELSTDSAGPQKRPAMGLWGYMGWKNKNYVRPPTSVRGIHRAIHVQLVRCWLKSVRSMKYYREPVFKAYQQGEEDEQEQLSLFDYSGIPVLCGVSR